MKYVPIGQVWTYCFFISTSLYIDMSAIKGYTKPQAFQITDYI